jgi:light-regulated signal transduction histidine kinase (bacteriophytochrome)
MDSLLSSLLVYAGLQRASSPTQVDLNAVMQHVQADLAMPIAEAGARVTAADLPTMHGDADRLYQLLLNLVANAIKFRKPGVAPEIKVSAQLTRTELRLGVEDNGIGIEAPDQGLIFDAFSRVYSQSQYEGNGLGLQICKQIVEQHGGRMWVESEQGQGSRFYAAFPRSNQSVKRR